MFEAGVIDEDETHEVGGDAEEVGAGLPVLIALLGEFEIGLVEESGGLESLGVGFFGEEFSGETAELVVDDGGQRFERGGVAGSPLLEEGGEGLGLGGVDDYYYVSTG